MKNKPVINKKKKAPILSLSDDVLQHIFAYVLKDLKNLESLIGVSKDWKKQISTCFKSSDKTQQNRIFNLIFNNENKFHVLRRMYSNLFSEELSVYKTGKNQNNQDLVKAVYACILFFYFAAPTLLNKKLKIKNTLLSDLAFCFKHNSLLSLKLPTEIQNMLEGNRFFKIARWKYLCMQGEKCEMPHEIMDYSGVNLRGLKLYDLVRLNPYNLKGVDLCGVTLIYQDLVTDMTIRWDLRDCKIDMCTQYEFQTQYVFMVPRKLYDALSCDNLVRVELCEPIASAFFNERLSEDLDVHKKNLGNYGWNGYLTIFDCLKLLLKILKLERQERESSLLGALSFFSQPIKEIFAFTTEQKIKAVEKLLKFSELRYSGRSMSEFGGDSIYYNGRLGTICSMIYEFPTKEEMKKMTAKY